MDLPPKQSGSYSPAPTFDATPAAIIRSIAAQPPVTE
jgi:hypothetical protein